MQSLGTPEPSFMAGSPGQQCGCCEWKQEGVKATVSLPLGSSGPSKCPLPAPRPHTQIWGVRPAQQPCCRCVGLLLTPQCSDRAPSRLVACLYFTTVSKQIHRFILTSKPWCLLSHDQGLGYQPPCTTRCSTCCPPCSQGSPSEKQPCVIPALHGKLHFSASLSK